MGLDFPYIAGSSDQLDEYLYRRIVQYDPLADMTPELLYGDKTLMWLRLLNNGVVPDELRKGEYFIHVRDYGAVGNGTTDDTAAILAAAAVAVAKRVPLLFDGLKSYRIENCQLPANLVMQTNGCEFVKTVNNATYALRTASGTVFDYIRMKITGGALNDAGVYINGSNTLGESIDIYSVSGDQPGANALLVGDSGSIRSNIILRRFSIYGFQAPMRTLKIDNCRFSNGDIQNFICGVFIVDTTDTTFDKVRVRGTSPSSVAPYNGQNGFLMEAQAGDFSCSNVRFLDCLVDGSPEHCYRIGGAFSCRNVSYTNCVARKPGNAPGNLSTGGGAWKALGVIGHWHSNIKYINCEAEDSNIAGAGLNNFTQFSLGFVEDFEIVGSNTRRQTNATYSAQLGIFMSSVRKGLISSNNFKDFRVRAIHIGKDGTDNSLTGVSDILIEGNIFDCPTPLGNDFGPIFFDTQQTVTKDIFIMDNILSRGNAAVVVYPSTTVGSDVGSYQNIQLDIKYKQNQITTQPPIVIPVADKDGFLLNYVGPVYSTAMNCKNGSRYVDTTTGTFAVMKAGVWTPF